MMLVEIGLNLALLLLLGRFSYIDAELTINVTADKCGNEYDLFRHERINLFLNSSSFEVANAPRVLGCLINLKSMLEVGRTCIRNIILSSDRKCNYGLFDYYTKSKPGTYETTEYNCYQVRPYCTTTKMVYARFKPFLAWSHTPYLVSATIYLEKDVTTTTTAAPPSTTIYVYKSSKGIFDPWESLMIPFGIAGSVCGCTCCLICCVFCCAKCCKDEATTPASNANNEELQEFNIRPAPYPSAPELPATFNRPPQSSYNHRHNNYSDEPPDYERALKTSTHTSKYTANGDSSDIPCIPPPPYPGV